jgi:hypothetical protein
MTVRLEVGDPVQRRLLMLAKGVARRDVAARAAAIARAKFGAPAWTTVSRTLVSSTVSSNRKDGVKVEAVRLALAEMLGLSKKKLAEILDG